MNHIGENAKKKLKISGMKKKLNIQQD